MKDNTKISLITLCYFDAIVSGADPDGSNFADKYFSSLNSLISSQTKESSAKNLNPYKVSIFQSFIITKEHIILDYSYLHDGNVSNKIVGLIMFEFSKNTDCTLQRDDRNKVNLFKPTLIKLFSNLKSIMLLATHHSLSLNSLLSLIKTASSLQTIFVLSSHETSWQRNLWDQSSDQLINTFKQSNYKIELKSKIGPNNEYYGFVITKE